MMTPVEVKELLDEVVYKNWRFRLVQLPNLSFTLQVEFDEVCTLSFEKTTQRGRKWYVSQHATRQEILQTALKAVLAAEEHEAREKFKYKGVAIYGPHIDAGALLEAALRVEVRQ